MEVTPAGTIHGLVGFVTTVCPNELIFSKHSAKTKKNNAANFLAPKNIQVIFFSCAGIKTK
jgi:hypothetical protein